MGSNLNTVQIKVFIDQRKNKVMFAEAGEDFVEILFSFLTLPLGTIARLSSKHTDSKNSIKIGSLTSLYQSVLNLDVGHFSSAWNRDALVNPVNSSAALCQKLKLDLNVTDGDINGSRGGAILVKNKVSFLITDDLTITPFVLDKSFEFLDTLGVEYTNFLDERSMNFGLDEFSNLLKWSLVTKNALTSLVIGGSELHSSSSCLTKSTVGSSAHPKTVKLVVQKSTNKVLCAQVENFFMEMLCSLLTIPLGAVIRLTRGGNSSPVAIDNVYNSVSSLGVGEYLKSEDVKNMLLDPKLASTYLHVTDFLPIYEKNRSPGNFLEKQSTFIVSDELEVKNPPSISTISKFTSGIPVADIEVCEESIGEQEDISNTAWTNGKIKCSLDCAGTFYSQSFSCLKIYFNRLLRSLPTTINLKLAAPSFRNND